MNTRKEIIKLRPWIILAVICAGLTIMIMKFDDVFIFLNKFILLIQPVLYGIGFAYVINLLSSKIECLLGKLKIFKSKKRNVERGIAIFTSVIIIFMVLILLFMTIIPQLAENIISLINSLPQLIISIEEFANSTLEYFNIDYHLDIFSVEFWNTVNPNVNDITEFLSTYALNAVDNLLAFSGVFMNLFMGFMISFYFLTGKEGFIRQMKKVVMGLFPNEIGYKILQVAKDANQTYTHFIGGQLLESCILGGLFYITMTLLSLPYALLISCMIAVLSLVPVLGAMIGWGVGTLLILAIDPIQALIFLITFQVVQQIEGNLIYPRVVGNAVGLPGAWTLVSVFVGGGLFGLPGILLGVPTASVVYSLFVEYINYQLDKKNLYITDEEVIEKE